MNTFYNPIKAILAAFLLLLCTTAQAAFVRNLPTEIKQPDGVTLHVLASGDEFYNWIHDENNFTIVQNPATGYYVYADKVNGVLVPTDYIVGKADPAKSGLAAGLLDDASVIKEKAEKVQAQRKRQKSARIAGAQAAVRPAVGQYNNIVVFIQFSDQVSEQWTLTKAETENRFNAMGVVSVKDFYDEVSNGQLTVNTTFYPQTSNVYPISYTDTHPRSYYQKNTPDGYGTDPNGSYVREHELLKNAIDYVSSQVPSSLNIDGNNDGFVDNVVFVVKGYTEGWAELLWPHRWSLFSQNAYINGKQVYDYNMVFGTSLGVGVISHELFHSFGAPDLYRYSSWSPIADAVGTWDLMCSEDWNTPQHMTTYMKQRYGTWMTSIPELTTSGTYTLEPVSVNPFASYKIKLPNTTDYLVLEYRKKEGRYESFVPATGLIVTLIHEGGNNAGGPVDEVYVFRKDGTPTTNGDLYSGAAFSADYNRTSFNDQTNPACFKSDGTPCGLAALGISNISAAGNTITFNYTASTSGTCTTPAWDPATAYTTGQEVSYAGNKYRAKWWTQNNQPDISTGSGQPWELLGPCGSSNQAPVVSITAPANNSTFAYGSTVNIAATATDADGSITRVDFLNGSNQVVGSDNAAPYEFSVSGLAAGSHTYKAVALDNLGAVSNTATVSFTISNPSSMPTVTIVSPTEGQEIFQYPTSADPINVLVNTNNDQVHIDSVQFIVVETICNGPGCVNVRRYTELAAPFTLSYKSVLNNNGFTQITAIAWAGNTSSDQSQVTFYARPLPELTIVSPNDNSSVTPGTSSILVDVEVNSDKLPIDSVVYTVYDTKTTGMNGITTERKFKVTTAPFDLTLPVLADQTFTRIFALAYGSAGKVSQSQSVQVNYNQVPTVTITSPVAGATYNVGGSVTVTATATDSDGSVVKVEIYSPHIPNSTVTLTAPPYTATFNNLPSSGIRGATSFVVKATDNKGGVNGTSIDVLENVAPAITVTSPLPQYSNTTAIYVVGGSMTVAANVTDNDGLTQVEISQGANAPVVLTSAPYTATFNNLPTPAPDGSIYFTVKATDTKGAVATKVIVAYKNRLPNVAITAPAGNSSVAAGSPINITTYTTDVDGIIAKVEFFNGSTKLGEVTSAPFNYTIASAVAGTYSLTAVATDDKGQSATSPAVTVNVPSNTCTVAAWSSTAVYNQGNRVSRNGTVYEAKWWTQNNDPLTNSGTYDVWKVIGPCNSRLSTLEALEAVSLTPVPFTEVLHVTVAEGDAQVEVYDMQGLKVASAAGSGTLTLSSASFAPGLYLCKVIMNGESKNFTVIKQ